MIWDAIVIGSGSGGALGALPLVQSGQRVLKQKVEGWRGLPALSGGGALFEGGVHWMSFAANIGLEVERVDAIRTGGGPGRDRSSLVVLRYACGAVGTIAHSWEIAAPLGHLRRSKIQGTHGAVTFESNGLARFTSGRGLSLGLPLLSDPFGYRTMLEDFLSSVRHYREPKFTMAMARRDIELLEQAGRSMRIGSTTASEMARTNEARSATLPELVASGSRVIHLGDSDFREMVNGHTA